MAIWYTDVATNQQQGVNFPGQSGLGMLTPQPGTQNNPTLEGLSKITAVYTMTGNETAGDIINIALLNSGQSLDPNGHISTGATAPGATFTVAIGDNDQGLVTTLPIVNPMVLPNTNVVIQAPTWVSGTSYAVGAVVLDATATPAYATYTCISAVSGSTAPHSDSTHWQANSSRYSTAVSIASANANVSSNGGNLNGQTNYYVSEDCWLQALVSTLVTPAAGATIAFRFDTIANN